MKRVWILTWAMLVLVLTTPLMLVEGADEWVYHTRPEFLTTRFPAEVECQKETQTSSYICLPPQTQPFVRAEVEHIASGKIWTQSFNSTLRVACSEHYCIDQHHDNAGSYPLFSTGEERVLFIIHIGYYIGANPVTGEPMAYQWGTGPKADEYPTPYIRAEAVEAALPTYDVWCDPRSVYCYYTDTHSKEHRLTRSELVYYIKRADSTERCIGEFCYDTRLQVIGLNPHYHLYQHQ